MKTIAMSATKARNNFFELLEIVAYKGYSVVVKKNNKKFVRIIPERVMSNLLSLDDVVGQTYGMVSASANNWPYEKKSVLKKEKQRNLKW